MTSKGCQDSLLGGSAIWPKCAKQCTSVFVDIGKKDWIIAQYVSQVYGEGPVWFYGEEPVMVDELFSYNFYLYIYIFLFYHCN